MNNQDVSRQLFAELTEPYRHELRIHCYRMLGSLYDAEDTVQESYLRAWRSYVAGTEVRSYRPWLYKIATNVCLDLLRQRKRRALVQPGTPMADGLPERLDVDESIWLEPFPDKLIPDIPGNPEAAYTVRESVSLAFMTALQRLSPQHRAVLILRDVLGWKATEVADHLEMSESAVNSATLRARQGLQGEKIRNKAEPAVVQRFLDDYIAAWEGRDIGRLVTLLKEDVIMSMPPLPIWFGGQERVTAFVAHIPFAAGQSAWKAHPVAANGQAGVAIYQQPPGNTDYLFFGIHVLTMADQGIERIDHFMAGDAPFLTRPIAAQWAPFFDLPKVLS